MKLTKQEKQYIQNKNFCEKYITYDWDGCQANEFFARKIDSNIREKYVGKPLFKDLLVHDIAINNVYINVTQKAWEKEELVVYLTSLEIENIIPPKDVVETEKYKQTFLNTCSEILDKINNSKYEFQK